VTLDELLAQSDWLRRLARSLTSEREVDDLLQETWLNALRRPPSGVRDLRAWLATVLRHLARSAVRSVRARERRERLAAPGAVPSDPAELAERVGLERRVSGIVLGLEPVYRDPILLRFWEDLAPGVIATRLGSRSRPCARACGAGSRACARSSIGPVGGAAIGSRRSPRGRPRALAPGPFSEEVFSCRRLRSSGWRSCSSVVCWWRSSS
jgi:DNA-directed RNA polymerase specialized sigma24 family protein